jgi:hypothetical protein
VCVCDVFVEVEVALLIDPLCTNSGAGYKALRPQKERGVFLVCLFIFLLVVSG